MKLEPGKFCPLIKKDCVGLQCSWFTQVRGTDPQRGQEVDEWSCAITWLPMLLINTANETRQGAAAIESLRNEVVGQASQRRASAEQLAAHLIHGAQVPCMSITGDQK